MLLKRLLFLLATAGILKLCSGQCHADSADLNTKWRAADVLSQLAHDYYQSLALGPNDANNNQKRFVSVYSRTLLLYMTNNKSSEVENIKDAAHRVTKLLGQPADVIAAPFRALISLIMNVVEGPLTDVQVTCSYEVKESECASALHQRRSSKIKRCHGYTNNVDVYNLAVTFANSCGFQNLFEDLARASASGTDTDAIDLFTEFITDKYTDTIHLFKNIMKKIRSAPATCNTLIFL